MVKLAAVFGVSGVGKTWLISRFTNTHFGTHVQASQLLRQAKADLIGRAPNSEELRTGAILENQGLIGQALAKMRVNEKGPIILDGHSVVDNDNVLVEIPVEVIRGFCPDGIIFVQAPPSTIVARRAGDPSRVRPERTVEEIFIHQERARAVCVEYERQLRIELQFVDAGDELGFASSAAAILR